MENQKKKSERDLINLFISIVPDEVINELVSQDPDFLTIHSKAEAWFNQRETEKKERHNSTLNFEESSAELTKNDHGSIKPKTSSTKLGILLPFSHLPSLVPFSTSSEMEDQEANCPQSDTLKAQKDEAKDKTGTKPKIHRKSTTKSNSQSSMEEEWVKLERELKEALKASIEVAKWESDTFEWWDDFIDRYENEAPQLVGSWPTIIKERRREVKALLTARHSQATESEEEKSQRDQVKKKISLIEKKAKLRMQLAKEAVTQAKVEYEKAKAQHEKAKAGKLIMEKEKEETENYRTKFWNNIDESHLSE